jgi:hypothetical protein
MTWTNRGCPCRFVGASPKTKPRTISGSASRSLRALGCLSSSLDAGPRMTWLTWTPGSKNISAEGGPERSQVLHGP